MSESVLFLHLTRVADAFLSSFRILCVMHSYTHITCHFKIERWQCGPASYGRCSSSQARHVDIPLYPAQRMNYNIGAFYIAYFNPLNALRSGN